MPGKTPPGHAILIALRVLGYKEDDGQWSAHCLETDLVGVGETFEKAMSHLDDLTKMQISFGLQTNQMSLLDFPAPGNVFETYNRLLRSEIESFYRGSTDTRHRIGSISLPRTRSKGVENHFVPA
jgi:predicted RNase H-like HicB family nuclease